MKIKSISIKNYKSIKEINLDLTEGFSRNAPYTFIGKNGCGKSNILEALTQIFRIKINLESFPRREAISCCRKDCGFTLQLDEREKERYGGVIDYGETGEVYLGGGKAVDYTGDRENTYPIDEYRNEISALEAEYNRMYGEFESALKEADKYLADCNPYKKFFMLTGDNEYSADDILCEIRENAEVYIRTVAEFFNGLPRTGVEPSQFLSSAYEISPSNLADFGKYIFEVRDPGLLPPAAVKLLGEAEAERVQAAHKKRVKEISAKLKKLFNRIKNTLNSVVAAVKRSMGDFKRYGAEFENSQKDRLQKYNTFIKSVRETVGKVYFLDYETAIDFTGKRYDETYSVRRNLNFSGPESVIEGFLIQNKLLKDGECLFGIGEKPDHGRLQEIQYKINNELFKNILPDFDKDQVNGLEIKLTAVDKRIECELFVIEKSGYKTPLRETSLGRQWYICYMLIAGVVKRNDFLILDEPAATLHPAAAEEIRQKLNKLAKNGVRVFISTHNPYMFPTDFKNVINVEMTDNGTVARPIKGEGSSEEDIGEANKLVAADLLFRLSEKTILVEGKADETCIKKFAEILGYDLRGVRFHVCDGDAILQMTKLCMELKVNFVALLDNDNKYKSEYYRQRHTEYDKIIDDIIADSGHCVFVSEGEKGQIEDLFYGEDKKKYFTRNRKKEPKQDPDKLKKITSANDCEQETLENFKKLLNRLGLKKLNT